MKATEKTTTVDETVDRLRSGVHSAVDKVANATTQAAEVLSQKGEQLKNVEQQFLENCRGYIDKNPAASLGIAVGAGFLLSRLISSR
ncbi:MAG: DUF883 C-terminal domain-containing protein [Methylicorpusculum sp.]|uniref:DUF883 C-terminal domain-containing protein n=1 Tax=Methylicorpusculum sp. TaxID=2713644 RepID=UPI0027256F5C|nr:DUF883 C-terminal domain-containing protein [Methylicorpusculum sp.]MDO8846704.1 DUF883 C-terminal domain-containing protein [Methylicorpusculum sp.]MDO8940316.1 DUF883 C-terminal domain-containing protein [Methylicorpusculum sp.]MDO9238824.1 DUF883 C-terminal domain-containing protein [Methylicorpusculum sp.]MDP2179190.1 DUF883 C-terminal domain-containing protein [Methylicorpusculum sp.]MDP2203594.1 DUF883 C-terminal domain-containing protein [Methylicorpusculum sp.]